MAMTVVYSNFDGLVAETRSGVGRIYVPDTLGSTVEMTDESGTSTDTFEYWSYGEERSHTGPSATPFTWLGILGYVKDILNKLYYVRARYFRPELGRWQTVDPLWPRIPAYSYVDHSPNSFTDQWGLFHWICDRRRFPNYCDLFRKALPAHDDPRLSDLVSCIFDSQASCNYPNHSGTGTTDPSDALHTIIENMGGGGANFRTEFGGNSGLCNGRCAYTDIRATPPVIVICESGLRGGSCGSLECLIMHEMLHVPGMGHKEDNDTAWDCLSSKFGCGSQRIRERVLH